MPASTFLLTLLTAALLPLSQAAHWDSCTSVSYTTLQAARDPAHYPYLGPHGLYANTRNKECVYVAATPGSAFAKDHPKEFADFMATVDKLQAESSRPLGLGFLEDSAQGAAAAGVEGATTTTSRNRRSAAVPEQLLAPRAWCGDICGGNWDPSYVCNSCACNVDQLICVDENTCTAVFRCK